MSVAKWPMKVALECIVALKEATWQSVLENIFLDYLFMAWI